MTEDMPLQSLLKALQGRKIPTQTCRSRPSPDPELDKHIIKALTSSTAKDYVANEWQHQLGTCNLFWE